MNAPQGIASDQPTMKTNRLVRHAALCLLLTCPVFGQGSFALQNHNTYYGIDAPVFDAQGNPLSGTNYLVELWGGATSNSLVPALELSRGLIRWMVSFSNGGYFFSSAGFLSVPAAQAGGGGFSWLQVRAWDARLGSSYEEVVARGLGGYGESSLFYAQGNNPFAEPPMLPAPLIGLQSFSLRAVVPEPSTWTLLALGGIGLGWASRRGHKLS